MAGPSNTIFPLSTTPSAPSPRDSQTSFLPLIAGPSNTRSTSTIIPSASSPSNPPTPSTSSNANSSTDRPQPPRPPNSWILYRRAKVAELPPVAPGQPNRTQGEVSSIVSAMWKKETQAGRRPFEREADLMKEAHLRRYPDYKYKPKKREDKANGRRRVPPEGSAKRKEARSSRGVSVEPSQAATPQPQRAGHPYPLSARPRRELDYLAGPSPPVSAACSPSTSNAALPQPDPFFSGPLAFDDTPSAPQPCHPQMSVEEMAQWINIQPSVPTCEPLVDPNAVYFDLPPPGNPVPATNTFSCGHLTDEEHDLTCLFLGIPFMPTGNQSRDLEVSFETVPPPPPPPIPTPFMQEASVPGDPNYGLYQVDHSNFTAIPPNLAVNQFYGDSSQNLVPSTSGIPADVAPYVPPAGAPQSSARRRVAADWTHYVQTLDGSGSSNHHGVSG